MTMKMEMCEKEGIKNRGRKVGESAVLVVLASVVVYRVMNVQWTMAWLLACACETWFAFEQALVVSTVWTPARYSTNTQLLHRNRSQLPPVDVFVTTADPQLEPPILTVNTVLSLMAVDYPPRKLAVYVSDDSCSPLVLYSLMRASEFATLWVPFCNKYGVQLRAPFKYFAAAPTHHHSCTLFLSDWKHLKQKYEELAQQVEDVVSGVVPITCRGDFATFASMDKSNHPSLVKVIREKKEVGDEEEGLPHLIYVCREKRPDVAHHYKAGAMNVLTRVSGLMTNAPFMLNVDCDMFANNPTLILQAMCSLLGLKPCHSAFVQFPQGFYNNLKHDPFGTAMAVGVDMIGRGMAGIQGPLYTGTNCFHRRKVMYGFSIDDDNDYHYDDEIASKESFGSCTEFRESVSQLLRSDHQLCHRKTNHSEDEVALLVAGCDYENATAWGYNIGWGYGSLTEDVLTSLRIHSNGWNSVSLMPDPPAFLGTVPGSGPGSLVQRKRWITGLLQVLFGPTSPIVAAFNTKLSVRQALAYTKVHLWGLSAIPDLCYTSLPAYSIITDTPFLPNLGQFGILIFASGFVIHTLHTIHINHKLGQSVQAWWNNIRISKMFTVTCNLFGIISYLLQLLGISDISYDVTQKEDRDDDDDDDDDDERKAGRFSFDESPMFVPGTALLMVHLMALSMALLGLRSGVGVGEIASSVWMVLCFWHFLNGLFAQGKYGIPFPTIVKSAAFAFLVVAILCWVHV